jgi:PAS domain S-box-containing protein
VAELLMFGQTQQMAINDLRLLNERLERRRRQIETTEALYRAAISAANAVPYQEDFGRGTFSYLGEGFEALTGSQPGELGPTQLRELDAPEENRDDGADPTRLLNGSTALRRRREYPFRRRDGELRWFSDASVVVTDEAGAPVGAIGMLFDVTARRAAEERLRRSEEEARRLAIITAMTSSAVVITDAERHIEWVNDAFLALTGFSLGEVRGRMMRDVFGAEASDPAANARILAAMAQGQVVRAEIALRRKDGGIIWVAAEVQPLRAADGTLTGFTAVGTDISAAKAYERRLEQLSAELNAILSVIPGGVIAFDEQGRVAYYNGAFEDLLQPPGELTGMPGTEVDALLSRRCAPGERPVPFLEIPDGGGDRLRLVDPPRIVSRTVRLIRGENVAESWRAFYLRDITQQAEVDRMKSEFLSTAAHELRTPMSSVHGFAELLVSRDFDAETARTIARTIHRQSSLLVQMVNELLDLARIEAGRGQDFVLEVQELAPIVRETANALLMPGDPRRVEFVPAEGDARFVNVDAGKLRLALTNVLSNAYKYSRGQGAIRVSLPTRRRYDRSEVGVQVQDEGVGMTPEQVDRVFERFFRADPGGQVAGTGLGMTLVKEIVEAMHGSVEVRSEFGRGTTVTLWLPVAASQPATGSSFQDSAQARRAARSET